MRERELYRLERHSDVVLARLGEGERGQIWIDLRLWFQPQGRDDLVPTRRGVRLTAGDAGSMACAVLRGLAMEGLLDSGLRAKLDAVLDMVGEVEEAR